MLELNFYIFNLNYFNNSNDLNLLGKIYVIIFIKSSINFDFIFILTYEVISILIIITYFL